MTIDEIVKSEEYRSMISDYKDTCLWSASTDVRPQSVSQIDYILNCIETYGDAAAYKRTGKIRAWLSPHSSQKSCG